MKIKKIIKYSFLGISFIMTSLCVILFIGILYEGSADTGQASQVTNNEGYGNTRQSTSPTNYRKTEQSESEELSALCDTKWEFTDAHGRNFVFIIKDKSQNDSKRLKVELLMNGMTNAYGSVARQWHGKNFEFSFPFSFDDDKARAFYPNGEVSHTLDNSLWDIENGYLYDGYTAMNSEDPTARLKIKKRK